MNAISGIAHGDIVAGLTNGDEDVLGKLLTAFGSTIRRRLRKKFRRVLTADDIDDLLSIAIERAWFRRDRLPEGEREVLLADATAADVVAPSASLARRLGITSSGVRSRRQRGLARLRRFVRTALSPPPLPRGAGPGRRPRPMSSRPDGRPSPVRPLPRGPRFPSDSASLRKIFPKCGTGSRTTW